MYCKKCGFNNKDESSQCSQCGTIINPVSKFKTPIIVLSILLFIVLIIPFITSKVLESKINNYKTSLKEKGIDVNIDSSNGYFVIKNKLTFKINNGRYLAIYLSNKLKEKYPDKKSIIDIILYEKNIDWELYSSQIKLNN